MRKIISFLLISLVLLSFSVNEAWAGFGVSPPYLGSTIIRPGTRYTQTINLLRTDALEKLELEFVKEAPEFSDWISFANDSPVMELGVTNLALTVYIDVPIEAALGNYTGKLVVKTKTENQAGSTLSISQGAEISIDFNLVEESFSELKLRNVKLNNWERNINLPAFIDKQINPFKIDLLLDNLGNTDEKIDKIELEILDIAQKNVIATWTKYKNLPSIEAFDKKEMSISYKETLEPAEYWAKIKIYKAENIIYSSQQAFTVSPTSFPIWVLAIPFLFFIFLIYIVLKIIRKKPLA